MTEPIPTGMCHCGSDVDSHSAYWDNHSPVEVVFEEFVDD